MTTKNDDSAKYALSQQSKPLDDPLEAIKSMHLEQLAVCKLKAEKEMQTMKAESTPDKNKQ